MNRRRLLLSCAAALAVLWLAWTAITLSAEVNDLRERVHVLAAQPTADLVHARPACAAEAPLAAASGAPEATDSVNVAARPTLASASGTAAPEAQAAEPAEDHVVSTAEEVTLSGAVVDVSGQSLESARLTLAIKSLTEVGWGLGVAPETTDALAEAVGLDARQRGWAQQVVDDTKARLRDLRRTRDENGRTWERVQSDAVRWVDGVRTIDDTEATAFRDRLVPGSQETFGAAEARILSEARERIRGGLYREQAQTFDQTSTDGLFGPRPPSGPAGGAVWLRRWIRPVEGGK